MKYKLHALALSLLTFFNLAVVATAAPDLGDYISLHSKKERDIFEIENAKQLSAMRVQPSKFSKSQKLRILNGAGDILYFHAIAGKFTWPECEQEIAIRKEALSVIKSLRDPSEKDLSLAQFYYQRSLQRGAHVLMVRKDFELAKVLLTDALNVSNERLKTLRTSISVKTDSDAIADGIMKCNLALNNREK